MRPPRYTPESLAQGYLAWARYLFDASRGRWQRRPKENPREDPYFETLVACYRYAQTRALAAGFTLLDIARNADTSRYNIGPNPLPKLANPLRRAVLRAERSLAKMQIPSASAEDVTPTYWSEVAEYLRTLSSSPLEASGPDPELPDLDL